MRIILYSNQSGSREGVIFTEDTTTEGSELIPFGTTIDKDLDVSTSLDSDYCSFPLDTPMEKQDT